MRLGDREVNDFGTPYVIAEIGANHNGDMDLGRRMIDSAKSCGCDAVKFQSWTPDSLVSKEEYERNRKYNDSSKKHFGSLREMVNKYYLRKEQHWELKKHCIDVGIDFCSTAFSDEEADLLGEIEVPFFKIASMDINNPSLLRHVARKRKPIMLSTGMANLGEIETAVRTIEGEGNPRIILLHCISIYPPEYRNINLNNIPMLRQTFGFPVGFSDHTIGTSIPLASIALGSCVIEKHFTLDKDMAGWDHEISANPEEMGVIVKEGRHIVEAMGSYRRHIRRDEEEKKIKFRRSIVAKRDLKKGSAVAEGDICFKRPGTGIRPDEAHYVVKRKLNRDIPADALIGWEDLL